MSSRFVQNPYRQPGPFPTPACEPVRAFHRTLPGYAPTPLIRRQGLARSLGIGDLWVKYEGERFGLQAFKGLGGSWALHRLLTTRAGTFTTVSTASEGNHGRAVAWASRLMKVPCVIFLPAHAAPQRVDNIRREGATVILVDGTYEDAVRRCDVESRERGWQIISDVGYEGYLEIPPLVVEGYSTLYLEVEEQLREAGVTPDLVLIPGGVGGILQAGVDFFRSRAGGPAVVGVEPAEADCLTVALLSAGGNPAVSPGSRATSMACLNCAEVSLPSWPPIRRGVDALIAIEDRWAETAVRRLWKAEGETPIEAGDSGAASTGGLIALMEDPDGAPLRKALGVSATTTAVVVCTEGAIDRAQFERVINAR